MMIHLMPINFMLCYVILWNYLKRVSKLTLLTHVVEIMPIYDSVGDRSFL